MKIYLFPACAGVILFPGRAPRRGVPFPRMRGGDPEGVCRHQCREYFSPHARG